MINADSLNRYLSASRNPEGREHLLTLAADVDEDRVAGEIRLHRRLCVGLALVAVLVLTLGYPF
jgi:hypothetical protein